MTNLEPIDIATMLALLAIEQRQLSTPGDTPLPAQTASLRGDHKIHFLVEATRVQHAVITAVVKQRLEAERVLWEAVLARVASICDTLHRLDLRLAVPPFAFDAALGSDVRGGYKFPTAAQFFAKCHRACADLAISVRHGGDSTITMTLGYDTYDCLGVRLLCPAAPGQTEKVNVLLLAEDQLTILDTMSDRLVTFLALAEHNPPAREPPWRPIESDEPTDTRSRSVHIDT